MIDLVVVLKGVVEFAALMLLGQGIVYLLSFGKHEANAVYRMFVLVTSPVVKVARVITPRQVSDRHIPFVGFLLLFWVWFGLTIAKVSLSAPMVAPAVS
ncbi:MAG: hypothetical protein RLY67_184 [Pseudomonadota bacterium]